MVTLQNSLQSVELFASVTITKTSRYPVIQFNKARLHVDDNQFTKSTLYWAMNMINMYLSLHFSQLVQ